MLNSFQHLLSMIFIRYCRNRFFGRCPQNDVMFFQLHSAENPLSWIFGLSIFLTSLSDFVLAVPSKISYLRVRSLCSTPLYRKSAILRILLYRSRCILRRSGSFRFYSDKISFYLRFRYSKFFQSVVL